MTDAPAQRVAVVTGGTRGIGRAVSLDLVVSGFSVVATFAHDEAGATETGARVRDIGGRALMLRADVADEREMSAVFGAAEAEFGGVDVVVNVAGYDPPRGPLVDLDMNDFDAVIRTNLRGTIVTNKLAAAQVRSGGSIVNFSTSSVQFRNPGSVAYAVSKAGVEVLTLALARELRGRDVTVNAVAPGPVETDMLVAYIAKHGENVRQALAQLSPLGRIGRPGDIAQVVNFLVTTGRWINGQVIQVSGGAV